MAYQRPSGRASETARPPAPPVVDNPNLENVSETDPRVAITVSVSDGFRFGCGLILAGVAFYFALIMVVAVAFLVATILGLPLPFGIGGHP